MIAHVSMQEVLARVPRRSEVRYYILSIQALLSLPSLWDRYNEEQVICCSLPLQKTAELKFAAVRVANADKPQTTTRGFLYRFARATLKYW